MQDSYPYLPGHLVEFKDGGLQIKAEPNAPTTESILIMGVSPDGPKGTPVAVDPGTVTLFGKGTNKLGIPIGNTLLQGFEEAWAGGCRDIRLMRISGEPAKTNLDIKSESLTSEVTNQITEVVSSVAPGNVECSFQVTNFPIVTDSIVVTAKHPVTMVETILPDSAIKTSEGGTNLEIGTVVLNANVTGVGYLITIAYDFDNGTEIEHVVESEIEALDGSMVPFVTSGTGNLSKTLTYVPLAGTLSVTVDGEGISADNYTLSNIYLNINQDIIPPGANVLVTYSYSETMAGTAQFKLESAWCGEVYNDIIVAVDNITNELGDVMGKKVIITMPVAKVGNSADPLVYTSIKYPTLNSLAQAINLDLRNGVGLLKASCPRSAEAVLTTDLELMTATHMTGGDNKINLTKDQIYAALQGDSTPSDPGMYKLLENYKVDNIVPMGVNADDSLSDPTKNFSYQLALACAVISHRSYTTHGYMAARGPEETSLLGIHNYVNDLVGNFPNYFPMKDINNEIIRDEDDNAFDLGRYISVLAGPDIIFKSNYIGIYTCVSAANYAGMVSNMKVSSSPMNKEVPGIKGLRFGFGNPQLNTLVKNRFVCYTFKDNNSKIVVQDAMTAAPANSDYSQLNSYRAVKKAVEAVRIACDPYLGEPPTIANKNAMSTAISKKLEALQTANDINGFGFEIIQNLRDMILGNAIIELTIVPPLTLRRITTNVTLKPAM